MGESRGTGETTSVHAPVKSITSQLQALFATRHMQWCGLYQFTLATGGTLYYSSGDVSIYLNSALSGGDPFWANQTFSAGGSVGPYLDRKDNKAKMHQKRGVEVDTLVFDVIPGSSTVQGVPFLSAVRQGVFDGAELTYLGAYWPLQSYANPVVPTGTVIKFAGRVAEVDVSRSLATFTVNSHLELLNQNMPRNLFQSGCVNTLYDVSCTLNKATFATSGTAASGSTAGTINATLSPATGYFDLGMLTFTSGANNGFWRTVKSYTHGSPGTISLIQPFPNTPAAGDAFTVYPGCDKAQATCASKFGNLANFRGFPFVPQVETAV